jgi:zinc protease
LLLACAALALAAPAWAAPAAPAAGLIPVESFTLSNGLKVVFHIDRSDPVVAVALNAHVGSARELPGRTGFAHLFEHLFFLESENLGKGGLDKMSARIGGSGANGSTNRDMTDYFQTVPNDALEKLVWAEADKLGFFINTVTEPVLAKEKQVVKNEKRQAVDNQPYGHTSAVVAEALYPAGHPYSWEVIGSLKDLDAASLADVKQFYRRWYVPGNVTLVVAGDFDPKQARAWVEKYFAEIPAGAKSEPVAPRPAKLAATRSMLHEDAFAQLPELNMVWPAVPAFHEDTFALQVLAKLLTDGKEAPLNAVLIDEKKLTGEVAATADLGKLSGEWWLRVRAFDGVDLDAVKAAIGEGFARFERAGVDAAALERARTALEVELYGQIGSVLGKANWIARYDIYAGDPAFADRHVAAIRGVTAADVERAYRRHIKGRPHVATSFVPKGKAQLALAGATPAKVVEEAIVQGAEAEVDAAAAAAAYARTPSSFDRSVEPAAGARPEVRLPDVWQERLGNGLKLAGIADAELPVASFELAVEGGRKRDDAKRPGVAAMLARMFTRGTARRTPAELENALKSLGAEVEAQVEDEKFVIRGDTLARNFAATIDLVEEMLLEPRWDPAELELARAATLAEIQDERSQPAALAERAFELATYGPDSRFARSRLGTEASVKAVTMADLKSWHAANLAPNLARFAVAGAVEPPAVRQALADLGSRWPSREVAAMPFAAPPPPAKAQLFFYDVPGAKQSVFAFGYPAPRRAEPDYYPAVVMNYILGGGGFASRLTQQLREGKGYTYGIRSGFAGGRELGEFRIDSGVRSNATLEAAALTRDILKDYGATFTAADLEVTKSFLTKSRARSFETQEAKLGYLGNILDHGLPADYPRREQAVVDGMTVEGVRALAGQYLRPDAMRYVIVGDAATQAGRLEKLGYGAPVMVKDQVAAADR